uniref:Uncharacterized protein n=1 Tax=Arundo donax TaxID=35708 RepID=A0A0A8Z1U9_ARUDO
MQSCGSDWYVGCVLHFRSRRQRTKDCS